MSDVQNQKNNNPMIRRATAIVWLGIFCCSTSALFVRYSTAPSLVLAAYRKTLVTLMLAPMVLLNQGYREELLHMSRKTWGWCFLSGSFLAVHFLTYFLAVHNTTVAAANVLAGLEVLFVALFMMALGKEKYGPMSRMGIAVALAGGVLVAYTRGGFTAGGTMMGNIYGIVCASMIAAYSTIGTKVRAYCSNTVYTFVVYGTAALVLNLLIPLSGYHYFGYGWINILLGGLMAIFNSLLGHSIFNWSLKYLSPTLVAMIKVFQPVFAALWALLYFREIPTWNQLAGGVIVISGIFLYIKHKDKEQS